jgi:hypothetical protein
MVDAGIVPQAEVEAQHRLPDKDGVVREVLWHRSAETLHGSSLVPWKRENALELLEHIQRNTGRHWLPALAAAWDVSEYTLYGRFARDVLGDSAGQFVESSPLCHD